MRTSLISWLYRKNIKFETNAEKTVELLLFSRVFNKVSQLHRQIERVWGVMLESRADAETLIGHFFWLTARNYAHQRVEGISCGHEPIRLE